MFCDLFSFIAVFVLKSEYHNKMHVSLGKFILTLSIIDIIILCKNKYMHSAAMFTDFFWLLYIDNLALDTFSSFQQPSTLPCNRHFRSNPRQDYSRFLSASKNIYSHLKQIIRAIYERVQRLRHDSSSYMPCVYVWMLKEKKRVFLNSNFYMIFPVPCNWKQINYAWQDAKLSSHLLPVKTNQLT